jgi:hypothetical protein
VGTAAARSMDEQSQRKSISLNQKMSPLNHKPWLLHPIPELLLCSSALTKTKQQLSLLGGSGHCRLRATWLLKVKEISTFLTNKCCH